MGSLTGPPPTPILRASFSFNVSYGSTRSIRLTKLFRRRNARHTVWSASENGSVSRHTSKQGESSECNVQKYKRSLENLFCYDKEIPEEVIEKPIGLSLSEKNIGSSPRCRECEAKGAVLCETCSGSGLYIESILESQGILVKVRCLGLNNGIKSTEIKEGRHEFKNGRRETVWKIFAQKKYIEYIFPTTFAEKTYRRLDFVYSNSIEWLWRYWKYHVFRMWRKRPCLKCNFILSEMCLAIYRQLQFAPSEYVNAY